MTNDTHFKNTDSRFDGAHRRKGRLPDHSNFAVECLRYGSASKGLQHDQPSCRSHGLRYGTVLGSIRVQVGTGKQEDDRPPGMARAEGLNSRVALAGMNGDQQVASSSAQKLSDRDFMTDLSK